ncbi:hypothetical protein AN416_19545 [Paraburkholderia caribensis]|nr:hypothetical protein AN416_19545 [Paraburkholderia caribensis]AUT54024.1 hypothetical protein C2L66_19005 [Paraburkholderia caribensis]
MDDARQSEGRAAEAGAVRGDLRENNVPRPIVPCAAAHFARLMGMFLAKDLQSFGRWSPPEAGCYA